MSNPIASPTTVIEIGNDPDRIVQVWMHYEQVAMHFNDLMMRWRLQAIGGMATLVTLAGFVVGDAPDLGSRYRAMLMLAGLFTLVWIGVALIDLAYYRRLLTGAVRALLDLEARTADLKLSTKIEAIAENPAKWGPYAFYLSGFIPLVGIVIWAVISLSRLT